METSHLLLRLQECWSSAMEDYEAQTSWRRYGPNIGAQPKRRHKIPGSHILVPRPNISGDTRNHGWKDPSLHLVFWGPTAATSRIVAAVRTFRRLEGSGLFGVTRRGWVLPGTVGASTVANVMLPCSDNSQIVAYTA